MATDTSTTIDTLNGLIQTLYNSKQGYAEAAEEAGSADLKRTFMQRSQQRMTFIGELQQQVRHLGGEPAESGSAAGALHRAWINVRDAVTGKDDDDILKEVDRGEEVALGNYRDALDKNLPDNIASIVQHQHSAIERDHRSAHSKANR